MQAVKNVKNGFIMYYEYAEHFELLTDEEIGQLMRALFAYETTGEVLELTGAVKMAFSFIRADLDKNREKYEERCNKNAENGKSGGRPKNKTVTELTEEKRTVLNKTEKSERFFEKPKKADSVSVSDRDSEQEKNIKKETARKKAAEPKNAYGEFGNVSLSEAEYSKLIDRFGEAKAKEYIERLSGYIASKGAKYKSHYATILNWAKKDDDTANNKASPPRQTGTKFTNFSQDKLDFADIERRALIGGNKHVK